jgi:diacylglycerol kinase (ATP)
MKGAARRKRIAVILNGISFQKNTFYKKFLPVLQQEFEVNVSETLTKNHAIALASKAVEQFKYDAIIAAGGDGTLNQVVHGVLKDHELEPGLPPISLIPLGSGNDFARTAQVTSDPRKLLAVLKKFDPSAIDVGLITYTTPDGKTDRRYFVNVADIGMGPEVVQRVNDSGRMFGPAVAYYKAIIATFLKYKPLVVRAVADDWQWSGKLRSLAVANGKFYGHGLCVAPDAILNDGIFDAFVCGDVSVFDFIRYSETLKKGKHVRIPEIHYKRCKSITLACDGRCLIEGDGEVLGSLPAKVEIIDRKLDFLK